ncbi:MAG: 3-hydroxyacyl-CoA dehydrogenase NAD-binding domain-containing protein [Candidatus Lokiarchaeia archaeon]
MKLEDIKNITVLGAGAMGHGIAQLCAVAGYNVVIRDIKQEFIDSGVGKIKWSLDKLASKGKIPADLVDASMGRITTNLDLKESVKDCDFMIEAIPEILKLKQDTFKEVDEAAPEHAILATNTSALPVTEMAAATKRPEKVVGMHFFNPPQIMRLVEVIYGDKTSKETAEITYALSEKLGKQPVYCLKDIPGFLANRVMNPPGNFLAWLVSEKIFTAAEIDSASHFKLGNPMATFGLIDYVGIDVGYHVQKFFEEKEPPYKVAPILEELMKKKELGVKTGKGFYEYPEKKWRVPPEWSQEKAEKFDPMWSAFVAMNRAVQIVADGVASVEDVDKAVQLGFNMPFGMLQLADSQGLDNVVKKLEELDEKYGKIDGLHELLDPHPLLRKKAEAGEKFYP